MRVKLDCFHKTFGVNTTFLGPNISRPMLPDISIANPQQVSLNGWHWKKITKPETCFPWNGNVHRRVDTSKLVNENSFEYIHQLNLDFLQLENKFGFHWYPFLQCSGCSKLENIILNHSTSPAWIFVWNRGSFVCSISEKLRCEEVTWWGDGAIVWVAKINVVGGFHDNLVGFSLAN